MTYKDLLFFYLTFLFNRSECFGCPPPPGAQDFQRHILELRLTLKTPSLVERSATKYISTYLFHETCNGIFCYRFRYRKNYYFFVNQKLTKVIILSYYHFIK